MTETPAYSSPPVQKVFIALTFVALLVSVASDSPLWDRLFFAFLFAHGVGLVLSAVSEGTRVRRWFRPDWEVSGWLQLVIGLAGLIAA